MTRFLIIDKPQKVEIDGAYPYAISRIMEELAKDNVEFTYVLNSQIMVELIEGKLTIKVDDIDIRNFSHIIMRGQFTRRDYEIKRIIVEYVEKHNAENPDKKIKIQNAAFIKALPHYTKIYQMLICFQNDIPYLNTFYQSSGDYKNATGSIDYPKILKHYTGKNYYVNVDGKLKVKKNVFMVDNVEGYKQNPLSKRNLSDFFVQQFASGGQDIRIFMQKDRVVGGWKRTAKEGFLTVAKDSEYEMYNEPAPEIVNVCEKTARAFKSDFMAIDLIMKDEKPYILEVNMNPGFKAYETKVEGTPTNIARAIIDSF